MLQRTHSCDGWKSWTFWNSAVRLSWDSSDVVRHAHTPLSLPRTSRLVVTSERASCAFAPAWISSCERVIFQSDLRAVWRELMAGSGRTA
jgi:hypothetical protein